MMKDASILARVAGLIGEPARANMLGALMGRQALTATELAEIAGVSPQTASGHLAKLADGGLVSASPQGRHRYYRLASPEVATVLEGIMALSSATAPPFRPRGAKDPALVQARTCYDHLAGRLGVALADALRAQGAIELEEGAGFVTPEGEAALAAWGVALPVSSGRARVLCRPCLDWSERRWHVAGRVGAAITQRCFDLGWIARIADTRAVRVTERGRTGFAATFGLRF